MFIHTCILGWFRFFNLVPSKGIGEPICIPHIAQAAHPEGGW